MTSNRLILIFLGVILFIIVGLSSRQIGGVLRQRFARFLPPLRPTTTEVTPTPTFIIREEVPTLTPAPAVVYGGEKGAPPGEIPATGPEDLLWLVLGGSFLIGVSLRKITGFIRN